MKCGADPAQPTSIHRPTNSVHEFRNKLTRAHDCTDTGRMRKTCPTCHMLVVLAPSAGACLLDVHNVAVDVVCDFGDKRQGCWSKSPSNIWVDNDPVHLHLEEFWIFRPWSLLLVFLVSLS